MGIRWYDKVSNAAVQERTKLPDLPSLIADRCHSLFGHISCLPKNTLPRRHCNCQSQALQLLIDAHTDTPAAETTTRSSKENVAATIQKGLQDICWSDPDHKSRSLTEIITTLS